MDGVKGIEKVRKEGDVVWIREVEGVELEPERVGCRRRRCVTEKRS